MDKNIWGLSLAIVIIGALVVNFTSIGVTGFATQGGDKYVCCRDTIGNNALIKDGELFTGCTAQYDILTGFTDCKDTAEVCTYLDDSNDCCRVWCREEQGKMQYIYDRHKQSCYCR